MSYSNGLLPGDSEGQTPLRGLPGVGFSLTEEGDFDIKEKKLTNIKEGTEKTDAVTKAYVDGHSTNTNYLKVDGSSFMTGDLNLNSHKIVNLKDVTNSSGDSEAVNKKYVDTKIDKTEDSVVGSPQGGKLVRYLSDKGLITPKMYIEDEFGDSVIIKSEDQDYDDVNLHIPNLQNYDGISGRRKSSFVINSIDNNMTGKIILPSGNLVIKDGNNQTVLNRADINKIFGSSSGQNGVIGNKVALYSSEGSLFAKTFAIKNENDDDFVILRCRNSSGWRSLYIPSLDSNADIIIDQTNQTINGDKTFSQAITMIQEGSANNHLVTKKYVDDEIAKIPSSNSSYFLKKDGSVAMTGDLNMNEQRVKNTLDPTDEQDTVNKRYLESQLTDYLKRNGQNTMTFDLNMNSYKIVNLKDITSSSNDSEAVNKKYVDLNFLNFLKLDGSVSMSGDLNMASNKIKNLGTPSSYEANAAVNVEFFNSELNSSNQNISRQITTAYKKYVDESLISSQEHFRKNAFLYLMEDVDESSSENNISVTGIIDYALSIHQMNKKVYQLRLNKDLGSTDYRSRIGFNLGSLNIGYYTFVCEFFPPTMTNVSVTASGTTISITKQATKTFPTYTKTIVQFHRWNSTPPQFIYLDLHGSTPNNSPTALAFMVVYGVEGYFPNVPSSVFDQVYVVDNGRMVMQTELDLNGNSIRGTLNSSSNNIVMLKKIDMNNQKIINVAFGIDDNDAVNRKQLEDNLKFFVYGGLNIGENKFLLNGFTDIIMPHRNIINIFFVYKTYNSSNNAQNLPRIGVKIKAGNTLNLRTLSEGVNQHISVNQTMTQDILSVELNSGPISQNRLSRDRILMLIELSFQN